MALSVNKCVATLLLRHGGVGSPMIGRAFSSTAVAARSAEATETQYRYCIVSFLLGTRLVVLTWMANLRSQEVLEQAAKR